MTDHTTKLESELLNIEFTKSNGRYTYSGRIYGKGWWRSLQQWQIIQISIGLDICANQNLAVVWKYNCSCTRQIFRLKQNYELNMCWN